MQALHEDAGCIHSGLTPEQLVIGGDGRVMINNFNDFYVMSLTPDTAVKGYCPVVFLTQGAAVPIKVPDAFWRSPEDLAGQVPFVQ